MATNTSKVTSAAAPSPEAQESTDKGDGSSLERITVNLTKRSARALERTAALTTENKTEVTNKALQFYAYVRELLDNDGALYVREPGSDEKERIKLL